MEDKLNQLLRQWAEAKSKTTDELRPLEDEITDKLASIHQEKQSPIPFKFRFPTAVKWAIAGVACLLIVSSLLLLRSDDSSELPTPTEIKQYTQCRAECTTPEKLDDKALLFDELELLFSDRFRWFADYNGEVRLHIDDIQGSFLQSSRPIYYRLSVLKKDSETDSWQTSWSADLLFRSEELVEVKTDLSDNDQLLLWVYPVDEHKAAFDVNIPGALTGEPIKISDIQTINQPMPIKSLRRGDDEYIIYQTVSFLGG